MNRKKQCKIVNFGERAREAMISAEEVSKGNFGTVIVIKSDEIDGEDEGETLPCFETTVGYAIELREHLIEAGKPYGFDIAVQRSRSRNSWRIAEKSEWVPAKKGSKSKRRIAKSRLSRLGFGSDL